MNIRLKKRPFQSAAGQVLLFILPCGYLAGCTALELGPITYEEAVAQYQQGGGIENYRCVLVPADEEYRLQPDAEPVAIEIDDVLFVKITGTVQALQQTEMTETRTAYVAEGMSATLTTVSQFDFSEYNESDDRHVDFVFEAGGNTETYKTFGAACGL